MKSLWVAAAFGSVSIVGTGCGEGVDSITFDEAAAAIAGGSADSGDPAVVALTYQGQVFCTGTLVAPQVVLTAAHCLSRQLDNPVPIESIDVFFGNDVASGEGETIAVVDGGPSPAFAATDPNFEYHDVGMLRLAAPAPVTPVPLPKRPLDDTFIGQLVREVGFGVTGLDLDDDGVKRQGTSKVIKFRGTVFRADPAPATICSGDSGGPSLFAIDGAEEVVVGVHTGGDCATYAADQRVDLELTEFILPFIEGSSAVPCAEDGYCATFCEAPDPDCPPACAAVDGACVSDCPVFDPDCATACGGDGACDESCPNDPDCPAGPCTDAAACDPEQEGRPRATEGGGCAVGRRVPFRVAGPLLLAFLLVGVRYRRRQW